MKAIDAKREIQGVLGVKKDGDIGKITDSAYQKLKGTPDFADWPPVSEPTRPTNTGQGLTDDLRAEYLWLWNSMELRWEDDHRDEPGLEAIYEGLRAEMGGVLSAIRKNQPRYEEISRLCGGHIPWYFIAIIHNLECGLSFNKHLHNGDALTARTHNVPAGRPIAGQPPFTFEQSAVDALTMPGKEYHKATDWSIPAILYRLEGYNGWGYRQYHPEVKSPYLWSGSNHYERGKYIADRQWSATAVSKQLGTAVLLRALVS